VEEIFARPRSAAARELLSGQGGFPEEDPENTEGERRNP
jgi:hypothetical protein